MPGTTWAKDLAARLGTVPGPVWVAVHHEPENDVRETSRTGSGCSSGSSPIFRAHPNIAFTIILMGYHQFAAPTINPKLSMDALYPGPGLVDVVGFDPYNWYGTLASNGEQITTFTELKTYYTKIAAWAASVGGVKWAVAETGYTDMAAQRDVAWLSRAYDDMKAAGGIALTYWDNQFIHREHLAAEQHSQGDRVRKGPSPAPSRLRPDTPTQPRCIPAT